MRKHIWSAVAAAAVVLTTACGDGDDTMEKAEQEARETATSVPQKAEGAIRLFATLTGAAVPPTPVGAGGLPQDQGDPDGTGTATVNLDASKGQVCYEVSIQRLDPPVGMHIHEGQPSKHGPVVVPLSTPTGTDTTTTGCVEADRTVIGRIAAKPGDFYLNVHTRPFPAGAVRGQLSQERG